MGMLQAGKWTSDTPVAPTDAKGNFQRADSGFRDWLTRDGSPGPDGQPGHRAEADRYHLYVSLACPWAHRTLVVRALKGLEALLPVTVVGPLMGEQGWSFARAFGGTGDPANARARSAAPASRAGASRARSAAPAIRRTARNICISSMPGRGRA